MQTKKSTFSLAITAMFCAIIIALTFIPYTGYITYGLLSITTLHIPVLLGTTLFPKRGLLFGTVWGVTCLLYALANGTNTALVLSAISLFGTGALNLGATLKTILQTALALNGVVETVAAAVLVTALYPVLKKNLARYL